MLLQQRIQALHQQQPYMAGAQSLQG
jgi:hypothetical protein